MTTTKVAPSVTSPLTPRGVEPSPLHQQRTQPGKPPRPSRPYRAWPLCLLALPYFGCGTGLPRVLPPRLDVEQAASDAMGLYDRDSNTHIDQQEAQACPGIARAWKLYDTDQDQRISQTELGNRFRQWIEQDTGMMNVRAEVTWKRAPLPGAQVKLIPLPFLGNAFHAASGDTDTYGYAFLSIPKSELPKSQQGLFGMQVGLYRVEITHPQVPLPARYHRDSELGVDLSPADSNAGIAFHLE